MGGDTGRERALAAAHHRRLWIEHSLGYAAARAFAGHSDSGGDIGVTATCIKADIAAAVAALAGEPLPSLRGMVERPFDNWMSASRNESQVWSRKAEQRSQLADQPITIADLARDLMAPRYDSSPKGPPHDLGEGP